MVTEKINKKLDQKQGTSLDLTRTGAAWNRTAAYWAAQAEDKICQLCNEEEENADHIRYCKALRPKRIEIDAQLAKLDPDDLPNPVRHGIAPAMKANPYRTFWGSKPPESNTIQQDKWMGSRRRRTTKEKWPRSSSR